jgi:hypothetical protein
VAELLHRLVAKGLLPSSAKAVTENKGEEAKFIKPVDFEKPETLKELVYTI